jgi:hypothetical protein
MTISRKSLKISAMILVALILVAQAIRIDKLNPPVLSEIQADPAVQPILRRACYNCHSNETVWPWYSNVAPASWLVASDVREGRSHVNFSEWGAYGSDVQSHKLVDIAEEVQDGEMPLWYYTLAHTEARLSPEERGRIRDWAKAASGMAVLKK